MSTQGARTVAVADLGTATYPRPPFSPDTRFPEYRYPDLSPSPNPVYAGVRELFVQLGLDKERLGSPDWNPLGHWVRPGATVLVKPNLVRHYHPYGLDTDCLVTHGSLIRAVCDYALKAAGPAGKIVIADAPLQSCEFAEVVRMTGIDALRSHFQARGDEVDLRDLRLVRAMADQASLYGNILVQLANDGDPLGYTPIDLGGESLHGTRCDGGRYRVTCYDPARMRDYHGNGKHTYVIANTLLSADVVINLPKWKTHHKAGLTGALKNFIGINGHKDCLPHHAKGSAVEGGDEYARPNPVKELDSWVVDRRDAAQSVLTRKAAAAVHKVLHAVHMKDPANFWEGSWYGNDTISRTTVDLNRIVRYADRGGIMRSQPQRAVLTIVDGVIAGEKDGPLAPTPKQAGLLVAGENPVAVDLVLSRLMGFRWQAIPTLTHALEARPWPLAGFSPGQVEIRSGQEQWRSIRVGQPGYSLQFEPHKGWKGHVEL